MQIGTAYSKGGKYDIYSFIYRSDHLWHLENCEPQIPASYHNNWKLEQEDSWKVSTGEMSKRQFMKNIQNGKYR